MAKEDRQSGETTAPNRTFRLAGTDVPARPLSPGLYLVATPIGNLGDITIRALETMAGADILACEDTRTSRVLLDRYMIRNRLVAAHEHNEAEMAERFVEAIGRGQSVALISDAGTPLVSDPGFRLARAVIAAGFDVVPIPGPSAPLAALAAAGLASDTFLFAGFLPAKDHGRRERLTELAKVPATLIFFESPHRIGATLAAARDVLGGERAGVVARELTKTHEEFRRGTLADLAAALGPDDSVKGEVVFLVGPPLAEAPPEAADVDNLLARLLPEMGATRAAAEAARQTGLNRKELYRRLLELKDGTAD